MKMAGVTSRSRGVHLVAALVLLAASLGLAGCCCSPDVCDGDADYLIMVGSNNGDCVVCPGDTTQWSVHPGDTIQFVNMTQDTVNVAAGKDAYVENHIFDIEKCSAVMRTVADLPEGSTSHTILHVFKCGGDDHGGPKMVVTEPPPPPGG